MNDELIYRLEKLEREVELLKVNRLDNLSTSEVSKLKSYLFERGAATLASGASLSKYIIISIDGVRRAIPTYNKFNPTV